jgi:hypothetical protein
VAGNFTSNVGTTLWVLRTNLKNHGTAWRVPFSELRTVRDKLLRVVILTHEGYDRSRKELRCKRAGGSRNVAVKREHRETSR